MTIPDSVSKVGQFAFCSDNKLTVNVSDDFLVNKNKLLTKDIYAQSFLFLQNDYERFRELAKNEIKKNKDYYIKIIAEHNNGEAVNRFLSLWEKRIKNDVLESYIEVAAEKDAANVKDALILYMDN